MHAGSYQTFLWFPYTVLKFTIINMIADAYTPTLRAKLSNCQFFRMSLQFRLPTKYQLFALYAVCDENPLVSDGFPSQRVTNAENVAWSKRNHGLTQNNPIAQMGMSRATCLVWWIKFLCGIQYTTPQEILLLKEIAGMTARLSFYNLDVL